MDVLYVEDDDAYARFVAATAARRGLNLRRVASRAELLTELASAKRLPHCVLVDLTLEDSSGLDLCDRLKSSPSLQGLPVIVITGSRVSKLKCLEHGAVHCLIKGADEASLEAILACVVMQNRRSQGLVDYGDLQLDSLERTVRLNGSLVARLAAGQFEALLLLIKSAPELVSDEHLYAAFRERSHSDEPPLTILPMLRNDVSRLRRDLGPAGDRIERLRGSGYAYAAPSAA